MVDEITYIIFWNRSFHILDFDVNSIKFHSMGWFSAKGHTWIFMS